MRRWSELRSTWPAKIPLRPMMTRMLKTAEPTIVPTPTSPLVMKTPEDGSCRAWRNMENLNLTQIHTKALILTGSQKFSPTFVTSLGPVFGHYEDY